jgi:hypothetical protein
MDLIIYTILNQYFHGTGICDVRGESNQVEEDEMGRPCSTKGEKKFVRTSFPTVCLLPEDDLSASIISSKMGKCPIEMGPLGGGTLRASPVIETGSV